MRTTDTRLLGLLDIRSDRHSGLCNNSCLVDRRSSESRASTLTTLPRHDPISHDDLTPAERGDLFVMGRDQKGRAFPAIDPPDQLHHLDVASSSAALHARENASHELEKPAFSSSQPLLVPASRAP